MPAASAAKPAAIMVSKIVEILKTYLPASFISPKYSPTPTVKPKKAPIPIPIKYWVPWMLSTEETL